MNSSQTSLYCSILNCEKDINNCVERWFPSRLLFSALLFLLFPFSFLLFFFFFSSFPFHIHLFQMSASKARRSSRAPDKNGFPSFCSATRERPYMQSHRASGHFGAGAYEAPPRGFRLLAVTANPYGAERLSWLARLAGARPSCELKGFT
jgi:hypothetical protein